MEKNNSSTDNNVINYVNKMIDKSVKKIKELYIKNINNQEVIEKINDIIINELPVRVVAIQNCVNRMNIEKKKNKYVEAYLLNNHYYYYKQTNLFIYYDSNNYTFISEDDLLFKILNNVSNLKMTENKQLIQKKQEIKDEIMNKIMKNDITTSIPESNTIQKIINYLYPIFFKTKSECKYFLTILGDNILRKNTSQIYHFVNKNASEFIDCIGNIYKDYFNTKNIISSFSSKVKENIDYKNCRIMDFKKSIENRQYWELFVENEIFNIVFVAINYSQRYDNSEIYFKKIEDNKKILFLEKYTEHNNTADNKIKNDIIPYFIDTHLNVNEEKDGEKTTFITYNELYYLWCLILDKENIPNLYTKEIFINKIKNHVAVYDEFMIYKFSNNKINKLRKFLTFWKNEIKHTIKDEIEVSELFYFFKKSTGLKNLSERELINIIKHFYPETVILNQKTLIGYSHIMWDKKNSIDRVLDTINISNNISNVELYKKYLNALKNKNELIVSKSYFLKYINKLI